MSLLFARVLYLSQRETLVARDEEKAHRIERERERMKRAGIRVGSIKRPLDDSSKFPGVWMRNSGDESSGSTPLTAHIQREMAVHQRRTASIFVSSVGTLVLFLVIVDADVKTRRHRAPANYVKTKRPLTLHSHPIIKILKQQKKFTKIRKKSFVKLQGRVTNFYRNLFL